MTIKELTKATSLDEVVRDAEELNPLEVIKWLETLHLDQGIKSEAEIGGVSLIDFGLKQGGKMTAEHHELLANLFDSASKQYEALDGRGQVFQIMSLRNMALSDKLKNQAT